MLSLPHIAVTEAQGQVVVLVDDYELFDFVDDFLVEVCGLKSEHVRLPGTASNTGAIVFPADVSRYVVERALMKLDPVELERVFRLNNPADRDRC